MDVDSIITVLVSLIVGAGSSFITFRLQFERFQSMDKEREKHWSAWRSKIDKDIEQLKAAANVTELALLRQTLEALVKRVEDLKQYAEDLKHEHIDPYEREVAKLRQSVDILEARGR